MKLLSFFRCIGLIFIWFILTRILVVAVPNLDLLYVSLLSTLLLGIIAFVVNLKKHYIDFAPKGNWLLLMILSLVAGVGASFFSSIAMVQVMITGRTDVFNVKIDNYVLFFIVTVVSAIMVEVFFRGILMNILKPHFRAGLVILIPAIIYSIIQTIPERMIPSLIIGLLLGMFYYYTRNIYTVIMIQLVYNLMWTSFLNNFIFTKISTESGEMNAALIFSAVGFVIMAVVVLLFFKLIVKNHKNDDMERTLALLHHVK